MADSLPEFTFTVEGRPPLANGLEGLSQNRFRLQEQVNALEHGCGDFFPIPSRVPIKLEMTLYYPEGTNNIPGGSSLIDITREMVIGILYTDNGDVCSKKTKVQTTNAAEHPEGYSVIKIRAVP